MSTKLLGNALPTGEQIDALASQWADMPTPMQSSLGNGSPYDYWKISTVRLRHLVRAALSTSHEASGEVPKWSDPKLYTARQRKWCEHYERMTGFEPLMCDYEAGNETFLQAAQQSEQWYESHTSDMFLSITRHAIPGSQFDTGESYV